VGVNIMPNAMTQGVRRLSTLGAMWGLGAADPVALAQLQAAGYDMAAINTAIALGATDDQLFNLPFPSSPDEIAAATQQLLNQLGGAQAAPGQSAATAKSYPVGAIPVVQTDIGLLDLSLRSTWDNLASQFAQVGQQLNAIAAQRPKDLAVVQMRSQYNALASKFSSAWSTVFSGSSPLPTLGDWQDLAVGSGFVVIGGILIASGVGIPLVALIVAVAAGLAVLTKWINSQNAQTAVTKAAADTQGQTFASLSAALAAAQARGDIATVNQILATMRSIGMAPPGSNPPTNWNAWLQQNMGLVILGLGVIVIVPPLLRRR
jgi:hypothetical protein